MCERSRPLFALLLLLWPIGAGAAPRRNLVLICVDTVREDTFALPERDSTPDAFTRWKRRAIRFRHVQSTSSWTVPAVTSVMTGLYPVEHQTGLFRKPVANLDEMLPTALSPSATTLAEILKGQGWLTASFVANPFVGPELLILQGFREQRAVATSAIPDQARAWLDRPRVGQPFFLYLHFMEAHHDHLDDFELVKSRLEGISDTERKRIVARAPGSVCAESTSESCQRFQLYGRQILRLRAILAGLFDDLQRRGLLADTIVVLFSDHGEEFLDHAGLGHGTTMYQELLHVPVMAWLPGSKGSDVDVPASLADVAPTILAWLDVKSAEPMSGVSLAGPRPHIAADRPLYSSGIAYGNYKEAVLEGSRKQIVTRCPASRMTFDLKRDPQERNADGTDDADRRRLAALLSKYEAIRPRFAPGIARLDAETRRRLQAIGYLQKSQMSDACE